MGKIWQNTEGSFNVGFVMSEVGLHIADIQHHKSDIKLFCYNF